MTSVDVRTQSGEPDGTVELDETIFGIQPNVPVMHQVVTAQLAARRAGTQSTLTRAEVAGGGAKPWRQKGGKIVVIDRWDFPAPKTKDALAALGALGLEGRVLVVVAAGEEAVWKSFRNLQNVHMLLAQELNAYDVLCSDWVVFTRDTLPAAKAEPAAAPAEPIEEPTATPVDIAAADDAEDAE